MPGTASRARTPLSTARLYAASLPDGNSNVIEISASAKSHLQRERENPLLQPRPFPALSLQCWKPQHCCFYYYIFFLPPTHLPPSVYAGFIRVRSMVTFWQISEIYVSLAHICNACNLPIFPDRGSQLVTLCHVCVCVCTPAICHMGPGSTTRILISLAQLMVMLAKCINGI